MPIYGRSQLTEILRKDLGLRLYKLAVFGAKTILKPLTNDYYTH